MNEHDVENKPNLDLYALGWDKLLTTKQICKIFGRSRMTINNWVRDLEMPIYRIPDGNRYVIRFNVEEIKKWARLNGKLTVEESRGQPPKKKKRKTILKPKPKKKIDDIMW